MRTYDEYKRILSLWEQGMKKKTISRETGIPRRTVIDCIERYETVAGLERLYLESPMALRTQKNRDILHILRGEIDAEHDELFSTYAYLFGLYLGDGDITKVRNVYRLRVALDYRYPQIIESCRAAMTVVMPQNSVNINTKYFNGRPSHVYVYVLHSLITELFPQHGEGKKHERSITLEDWQTRIAQTYPLQFWRGLYHSDGSRFDNVVNGKAYPRYQFCNTSPEITALFKISCELVGVHYTEKIRPSRGSEGYMMHEISVSRRPDVAFLDQYVGAKC